jgi:hypothetical protein
MNPNHLLRVEEFMNRNEILGMSSRVLDEAFDRRKSPRTNHIERSGKGIFEKLYCCFPVRFEEGSREMLELEEEFDPMHPQAWDLDGGAQKSVRELLRGGGSG